MTNKQTIDGVSREHRLNIHKTPYLDLLSGAKTCEVRDCSDRDFKIGDSVMLTLVDETGNPTPNELRRKITHVQTGYGLPDEICVLSYGPAAQPQGEVESLRRLAEDSCNELIKRSLEHSDQLAELGVLLRDLARDCMASDFNEHWDSFKKVESYLSTSAELKPRSEAVDKFAETIPKFKFETLVEHCKRLEADLAQSRAHVNEITLYQQNAVWFWQHDGEDYLQSLSCPIIIQPHHLREILEGVAQHNPIAEQPAPSHSGDANEMVAKVVLPERDNIRDLIAEVIGGDAYDCVRVWSAWGVGTMSEDDFVPIVDQDERLYEIADSVIAEVAKLNGIKP